MPPLEVSGGKRAARTVLLLVVLLLSPWPPQLSPDCHTPADQVDHIAHKYNIQTLVQAPCSQSRLVSAQGLSVPDESLGAGELAALDQFDQFESLLELSDDFTGGRGRGGKSTGSRRKAAFEDSQSLRQQQLELYHVAGEPFQQS